MDTRKELHCLDMVTTSAKAIGNIIIIYTCMFSYFKRNLATVFHVYYILGRIDKLMDGLKEKLETAYKASGGRKVNLISHSMGGLLVSCFISLYSDV